MGEGLEQLPLHDVIVEVIVYTEMTVEVPETNVVVTGHRVVYMVVRAVTITAGDTAGKAITDDDVVSSDVAPVAKKRVVLDRCSDEVEDMDDVVEVIVEFAYFINDALVVELDTEVR